MLRIRPDGAVLLAAACLALTACTADKDAFYPETARGDRVLEQRALDRVPAAYEPVSVTMTKQWGRRGLGTDTDIIGYDAWVRVGGCKGHVLVRFDAWGRHLTTADLTECS
ncbi:MAG TPA: hypothetical protein VIR38_11140 [Thalassobaculum sp.]